MASIVYLTDQQMIEYHRLNGSRTMNFWRPTTSRKISDFKPGDLLFFLSKGTERGIAKEKGIVGYGRYQKNHSLTFAQMWKIYGKQNGYDQEAELRDAILKITKNKRMPKTLSCLYLIDVVYFQAPIYLSEIGVRISKMIESYFYLDKEDPMATAKILNKAKEVGVDQWSALTNNHSMRKMPFEVDYCKHIISEAINRLGPIYNETDLKKAHKESRALINNFKSQDITAEMVKGSRYAFICIDNKDIEVFIPLVSISKDANHKIQLLIGHAILIQNVISKRLSDYVINVTVTVDPTLPPELLELFHIGKVNYLINSAN